jgi:hypothetical protein
MASKSFYTTGNLGFQTYPSRSFEAGNTFRNPRTINNTEGGQYIPYMGNFTREIRWDWGNGFVTKDIVQIPFPRNTIPQGSTWNSNAAIHSITTYKIDLLIIRLDNTKPSGSPTSYFGPQVYTNYGILRMNAAHVTGGKPVIENFYEVPAVGNTGGNNLIDSNYLPTTFSFSPFIQTLIGKDDTDTLFLDYKLIFYTQGDVGEADSGGNDPFYLVKGQYLFI